MENHQLNRNQDFYISLYICTYIYIVYSFIPIENYGTWWKHNASTLEIWWKQYMESDGRWGSITFQIWDSSNKKWSTYLRQVEVYQISPIFCWMWHSWTRGMRPRVSGGFPDIAGAWYRGEQFQFSIGMNEYIVCIYISWFRFNWWFIHPRLTTAVWDHWCDIFFGYTITFPKLIWSRFCWSMPIINTVDGPAKSCTTKRIVGCLPSINWWISLAHPQYDVSCHAAVQKHPMWRVLPAFLHTRAAAGFCTASLTVESAGFSSDRPTGAAFLLGSTLKLVN